MTYDGEKSFLLVEETQDPNGDQVLEIEGETFIKVKMPYSYTFTGRQTEIWTVDKKYPVKLEFDEADPRNVTLTWTSGYSGQFDLHYGDYKKTIVVESLF